MSKDGAVTAGKHTPHSLILNNGVPSRPSRKTQRSLTAGIKRREGAEDIFLAGIMARSEKPSVYFE